MTSSPKKYVTAGSPMHHAIEDIMHELLLRQATRLNGASNGTEVTLSIDPQTIAFPQVQHIQARSRAISGLVVEAGIHAAYKYDHHNRIEPPYAVTSTVSFLDDGETRSALLNALDGVLKVSDIKEVASIQVGQSDGNEAMVGASFSKAPDRIYSSRFERGLVNAQNPAQVANILREFISSRLPKLDPSVRAGL